MGRSQHRFSEIPRADIQRSVFDRSHTYKTTFNAGWLFPFYVDEVLPGDTFNLKATMLCRMATPIVPFMDNLYLETFFFFVPCRLLWREWQAFNGEQLNPDSSTDWLVPVMSDFQCVSTSLADYFGLPVSTSSTVKLHNVSALPFRAYNLIWNEWFRDENLQNSRSMNDHGPGPDDIVNYTLLPRGKRHDYFTSCLPWPQKGPGVEIPIGGQAPVVPVTAQTVSGATSQQDVWYHSDYPDQDSTFPTAWTVMYGHGDQGVPYAMQVREPTGSLYVPSTSLGGQASLPKDWYANLDKATGMTINTYRQAFQIQRLYERDARGGTRYTEILRSHFGVVSPDARLQRPEYLGGSMDRITVYPVQQTDATSSVSPQGNLAAYGVVGSSSRGFSKSFVEHGYIIGLVCVRADLTYQQGINKMWTRRGRFDFYWPALAHLGEQAVLNKEIYYQGTAADEDVFGYQERWAEYRYYPAQVTGKFRNNITGSLGQWHLAQLFTTLPVLSDTFIRENPPMERILAVPSQHHFLFDSHISLKCARPMPVYSVPGLIDHF